MELLKGDTSLRSCVRFLYNYFLKWLVIFYGSKFSVFSISRKMVKYNKWTETKWKNQQIIKKKNPNNK